MSPLAGSLGCEERHTRGGIEPSQARLNAIQIILLSRVTAKGTATKLVGYQTRGRGE